MRITSVQIKRHLGLRNCNVDLPQNTDGEEILSPLFAKMHLTILAGNNGTGKTSLMSFISRVFHNLPRFPDRIAGAFKLEYTLYNEKIPTRVTLERRARDGSNVYIEVPNKIERAIVTPQLPGKPRKQLAKGFVHYDDIRDFLPSNVIISAFSLHGEYPSPRPATYIGDRPVKIFDTGLIYGVNHYQFPSLSKGIRLLMELVHSQSRETKMLEDFLGAEFTGRVAWRSRPSDTNKDRWSMFSGQLARREESQNIYINDFELKKGDHLIHLRNMSSGQKMLFIRVLSILTEIKPNSLVILEEPELHLDPAWTAQLVSLLIAIFRNYPSHFWIASHSHSVINSVPSGNVLFTKNGLATPLTKPTLLSNEPDISWALYNTKPNVVEAFIENAINDAKTASDLEKIVAQLGESSTRIRAWRRLGTFSSR